MVAAPFLDAEFPGVDVDDIEDVRLHADHVQISLHLASVDGEPINVLDICVGNDDECCLFYGERETS